MQVVDERLCVFLPFLSWKPDSKFEKRLDFLARHIRECATMGNVMQISPMMHVLCIDDDQDCLSYIELILPSGCDLHVVRTLGDLWPVEHRSYDFVLIDPEFSFGLGKDIIARLRTLWPTVPIYAFSHSTNVRTVVDSIKNGALNFVTKPISRENLKDFISDARDQYQLNNCSNPKNEWEKMIFDFEVLPNSREYRRSLAKQLHDGSLSWEAVLLVGERGTGRRALAERIHDIDGSKIRRPRNFVELCPTVDPLSSNSIAEKLLDAFGPVHRVSRGKKSYHSPPQTGGTVYISDLTSLDSHALSQLGECIRIYSARNSSKSSRIRFIASILSRSSLNINEGARQLVETNFGVVQLNLLALREYSEDIPRLAYYYLSQIKIARLRDLNLDTSAIAKLRSHNWPGNLSQLRNSIFRAANSARSDRIEGTDIRFD